MTVRVVSAPTMFNYRSSELIRYKLAIETGPTSERFALAIEPPLFPDGGTPFLPVSYPDDFTVESPAIVNAGVESFAATVCAPSGVRSVHGVDPKRTKLDITVPANSTSTVTAAFRPWRAHAPFPGMQIRPVFEFGNELPGGATGTLDTELAVRPPVPRLASRTGVAITVRTSPSAPTVNTKRARKIRVGRTIRVAGSTRPRLRAQRMLLQVLSTRQSRLRTVATARTDRRGRFSFRWKPRVAAVYELHVAYRRQQRDVTSDYACPKLFRVLSRDGR